MAQIINSTFAATDGTLLWGGFTGSLGEKYAKPGFQSSGASPQIIGNKAVSVAGDVFVATYAISDVTPASADYSVTARVVPDHPYGGGGPAIRLQTSGGYSARLRQNGTQESFSIRAEGIDSSGVNSSIGETPQFTLASGEILDITAACTGATMAVKCQRLSDNKWLSAAGAWQAAETVCLTATVVEQVGRPGMCFFGTSSPAGISLLTAFDSSAGPSGPTITTQPANQTVTAPATATLTVAATASSGALSYQWQRSTNGGASWANVTTGTGGTTASYTTGATSVSGGGANNGDLYRCVLTDGAGSINSGAATLTVNYPPGVLTIPVVNNTDTSLPSTTVPHVVVHKLSDRVEKFNAASQTTDSSGNLIITSASFTPGQDYVAAGWSADGSLAFIVKATAA